MIKVKATKKFALKEFNKIKNLVRANKENNNDGEIYINDKFECDKEMAEYLTGNNYLKKEVVKIIEIIPTEEKESEPKEIGIKAPKNIKKQKKAK